LLTKGIPVDSTKGIWGVDLYRYSLDSQRLTEGAWWGPRSLWEEKKNLISILWIMRRFLV